MNRLRAILLLFAPLAFACAQSPPPEVTPPWLDAMIARLESEPVANPPAFIARYEYRGDTVYYLPSRCCDIWSQVFTKTGDVICAADGGMTGGGDGRCPDFFETRREEKIVWRDTRSSR